MSENTRIHIDLPAIEGKLGTGIRRVAAFMAIGLNASRSVTASALVLDHSETMFRFFNEEPAAEVLEEAGREFRMWIQANGLRELCSFLEQYLSDIYLAAAWIKLSYGGKVASGAKVPELPKDFVRKGLGTKLALLERDFGITAPHGQILSTFWDARNCLTHRLGFVGEADLTAGDALVVKWIGVESWLLLEGEEPQLLPLDLGEGVHTGPGGTLEVRTVAREKAFRLGERIYLDAHELSEILFSAQSQCAALTKGLLELAKSKGLGETPSGT